MVVLVMGSSEKRGIRDVYIYLAIYVSMYLSYCMSIRLHVRESIYLHTYKHMQDKFLQKMNTIHRL